MEGERGEGGESQAKTLSEEELQWVMNDANQAVEQYVHSNCPWNLRIYLSILVPYFPFRCEYLGINKYTFPKYVHVLF